MPPIGVADLVQDEYDCMLTPILTWLPASRPGAWWTSTHPQV
ncbi:hypothetical protein [Streptomyces endophyticus]|uniref:Uncharacterized protein n=1 Tax=Streptomyces endophyticus TaxID=714166 RepID=A0ABU6FM35_9ACTN|nr:hypothetical protein [Streptomyces endophyticus]MEB8344340.1 hypothetical protein [Streptomyces endophyticus]